MNHRTYDRVVTALPVTGKGKGVTPGEVSRATGIGYKTTVKYLRQAVLDGIVEAARYEYRAGIPGTLYCRIVEAVELSREQEVAWALDASIRKWTAPLEISVGWDCGFGMFFTDLEGRRDWHVNISAVVCECAMLLRTYGSAK